MSALCRVAMVAGLCLSAATLSGAERRAKTGSGDQLASAVPRTAGADTASATNTPREVPVHGDEAAQLDYVLQFARDAYTRICQEVHDYECQLYKRERVDGVLGNPQLMFVKIRHQQQDGDKVVVPFGVFLQFLKPERMEGREVLYIQDQNQGDLIARRGGRKSPNVTVQLPPDSVMAMDGNRYPITEIGFRNLTMRLIEVLEKEKAHNDGAIEIFPDAKVDGRKCTHFRLTHHTQRPDLTYHMAEVSVDNELKIPIYFRSFDWPAEEGGKPRLLEEYFYKQVRLNVGLTDLDFDHRNPEYHFQLHDGSETVADGPAAADEPQDPSADEPQDDDAAPAPLDVQASDKAKASAGTGA
ncbi:MAG: DUF1571 domain-containing protein [Planctomycetaceae bacterium]|nr:DUF1571 domain-containing protein [Planctomycetaceae bacterium]